MANRPISTNGETRAEYLSEELARLQHVQTSWALRAGMGIRNEATK